MLMQSIAVMPTNLKIKTYDDDPSEFVTGKSSNWL